MVHCSTQSANAITFTVFSQTGLVLDEGMRSTALMSWSMYDWVSASSYIIEMMMTKV